MRKKWLHSPMVAHLIVGLADGLTIGLALVAGISGGDANVVDCIYWILLILSLGAVPLAVSGYFAAKSDQRRSDRNLAAEEGIPVLDPRVKKKVFYNIGLSREIEERIYSEHLDERQRWQQFLERFVSNSEELPPLKTAMGIGVFYLIGGAIPLLPFFFLREGQHAFIVSFILTFIFLFVIGFFKAQNAQQSDWLTILRPLATACLFAVLVFWIGRAMFA